MFPKEMELEPPLDGSPITVEVPHDSPAAFTYFYSYIFFHDVKFPPIDNYDCHLPELQQQREQHVYEVCQTWVLGDKYSIPGLQNCAMFRLCQMLRLAFPDGGNCMTLDAMKYCYENTEPGAKLRKLVADYIIRIENRGHPTEVDLLTELSTYRGFTRDIFESQQCWNSGGSRSPTKDLRMRFLTPYRYAARYQVDVENSEDIPTTSRALWRPLLLTFRCHHCGDDGELRDFRNGVVRLCDACVDDYVYFFGDVSLALADLKS
jgi:hypothetical protein